MFKHSFLNDYDNLSTVVDIIIICGSGKGAGGPPSPLKNYKNKGFLSNTGPDHQLPSQHLMLRQTGAPFNNLKILGRVGTHIF